MYTKLRSTEGSMIGFAKNEKTEELNVRDYVVKLKLR